MQSRVAPGLVILGAVRMVASVASRLYPFAGPELCPADLIRWRDRDDHTADAIDGSRGIRSSRLIFRRETASSLAR